MVQNIPKYLAVSLTRKEENMSLTMITQKFIQLYGVWGWVKKISDDKP